TSRKAVISARNHPINFLERRKILPQAIIDRAGLTELPRSSVCTEQLAIRWMKCHAEWIAESGCKRLQRCRIVNINTQNAGVQRALRRQSGLGRASVS